MNLQPGDRVKAVTTPRPVKGTVQMVEGEQVTVMWDGRSMGQTTVHVSKLGRIN